MGPGASLLNKIGGHTILHRLKHPAMVSLLVLSAQMVSAGNEEAAKPDTAAGRANVGINAVIEADCETNYTVIVLPNYDPSVAERLGIRFMTMLGNRIEE